MKKIFLGIAAAALIAGGAAAIYVALTPEAPLPAAPGVVVVAEVNGKPITAEIFNEKYSRFTLRFHIRGNGDPLVISMASSISTSG